MTSPLQALLVAAAVDPLTGVATRAMLLHRLRGDLAEGRAVGLLVLDLVGFKEVNDTGGHAAGDAVLREVGVRLLTAVRRRDLVGRLGGDEFAVLVAGADEAATAAVAERVRAVLAEPHQLARSPVTCPASVGWALAAASTTPPADAAARAVALLDEADRAMYATRGTPVAESSRARPGEGAEVALDVGSAWSVAALLAARPQRAVLEVPLLRQAVADPVARRAVETFVGLLTGLGAEVVAETDDDERVRTLVRELGLPLATPSEQRTIVSNGETRPLPA